MAGALQYKVHERCAPQTTARRRIAAADEAARSVNDARTAEATGGLAHARMGVVEIRGVTERRRLLLRDVTIPLGMPAHIPRAMPDVMTSTVCVFADVIRVTRGAVLGSCRRRRD
jgi:hypothetical protein